MSFRSIVGHHRTVSLISKAIASQTLPPSLLLAGPEGVGKLRTAVAVAETLNCLQPRGRAAEPTDLEIDACGECASCRRIGRGMHPDVIVVEPGDSGSIKIEQVRDVVDRAAYRPFEGRRRVVIVDEADAMVVAAQNALLKTLEEPPPGSVFILVSSMPDALLPTVLSRCPRLRFGALAAADVAAVLMRDHGYDEAEARAAAGDADGSVGRALAAQGLDFAEARATAQRLLEYTARTADPALRLEAAKVLIAPAAPARDASSRPRTTSAAAQSQRPADERDHLAVCLRALASLLRDLGLLSSGADARALANADLQQDLRRLSASFDSARSLRAFAAADRALGALERNASPKVVADWLVLQL